VLTELGKFAAVSCAIWQTGPWNLEKFATKKLVPSYMTIRWWYIISWFRKLLF